MSDQPRTLAGHAEPGSAPPGPAGRPGMMRRQLSGASRATRIACIAAVLAIAAIAVISVTGNDTGARPHALPAARNFSLRALGHPGQRVSLAAFAGRPVIINFFASWCTPCQRETPALARFYRQSGDRVAIIGVDSNDQARAAMRFVHAAGVRYPVGVDPLPASTTTSYGVIALPQTFFLNAQHRIVKRVFGAVTMKELSAGVALMTSRPSGAPQTPGAGGG
jgi:thiol-disulfide isomerase/thioredoxin